MWSENKLNSYLNSAISPAEGWALLQSRCFWSWLPHRAESDAQWLNVLFDLKWQFDYMAFGLTYRLSLNPFCGQRAWGDSGSAAESLELCVNDLAIVIDFNLDWELLIYIQTCMQEFFSDYLEFHDIAAGRSPDKSGADLPALGIQLANVSRIFIMINNLKYKVRSSLSSCRYFSLKSFLTFSW